MELDISLMGLVGEASSGSQSESRVHHTAYAKCHQTFKQAGSRRNIPLAYLMRCSVSIYWGRKKKKESSRRAACGAHAPPSSGRFVDQKTVAQPRYLIIPEMADLEEVRRSDTKEEKRGVCTKERIWLVGPGTLWRFGFKQLNELTKRHDEDRRI